MNGSFIKARSRNRHDCAALLPAMLSADVNEGDKWVCPDCHRRWSITYAHRPGDLPNPGRHSEGTWMRGPDSSTYWRAARCKFIGAISV